MNSPLPKICIVSVSLAKGGAERSAAVLSGLLSNLGYEVHVAILTNLIDYKFSGLLYNLGADKENANHPLARFKRFEKFKKYLEDQKIDLVIDHRPKNNYYREVFYAKYLYKNIQRIYVVHNSKRSTYFAKPLSKIIKIYQSNFHTVGVSKFIFENLLTSQGIEESSYIPNAYADVWQHETTPLPAQVLELNQFILFYGRIENQSKDIRFLIDAYAASNLSTNNIALLIMGNGPDKDELETYASQLNCAASIHFLPYQKKPFSIIKKSKLVSLTSKYEGFPMVLIESLAMGTPVVSLDFTSGPSEVIQHRKNGLLVKKRSISDFACALDEMCFDNELYSFCKKNTQTSVEAFSEKEIALKWHQLLSTFPK
ncbi:glycosyltransferase [Psychroflexus salis]|uniref:Glycosyl transferase n=1 Tax=Psychroflexus salis TaxID=1526574 RepID=A0A916ZQY6_9FLAO|nr:glycosyltransferase [Psychroflexus salis]GGE10019.1 glycosyl transferase [Psychroflexus salis]